MVMHLGELDLVFGALSDPTRRGILERLSAWETKVGRLAEPFAVSQPAISKHLRVLERAGLIRRTKRGREHHIRVEPKAIEEARDWIAEYSALWRRQFDAVEAYLDKHDLKNTAGKKAMAEQDERSDR